MYTYYAYVHIGETGVCVFFFVEGFFVYMLTHLHEDIYDRTRAVVQIHVVTFVPLICAVGRCVRVC